MILVNICATQQRSRVCACRLLTRCHQLLSGLTSAAALGMELAGAIRSCRNTTLLNVDLVPIRTQLLSANFVRPASVTIRTAM